MGLGQEGGANAGKCCVFGGQRAGQLGWSQELPPVGAFVSTNGKGGQGRLRQTLNLIIINKIVVIKVNT